MTSVDDIPNPAIEPVGSARHHLLRAFALLRNANERAHWAVVHAHALACRSYRANGATGELPACAPLLDALVREQLEVDAAATMCERLLWRQVGEPLALSRWTPGDLAVLDARVVVRVLRVFGTAVDVLSRLGDTAGGVERLVEYDVDVSRLRSLHEHRVGDVVRGDGDAT